MARTDNYQIQARKAQEWFLRYDQAQLIAKLGLRADQDFLYTVLFSQPYRVCRHTGGLQRLERGQWQRADSHSEVMTLLDLICDSRENRFLCGRWKQMSSFGLLFHQEMLETGKDPFLLRIEENPDAFRRACLKLNGRPMDRGDISYAIEVFDGLPIWLQYWEGDEEFPSQLRWLWDENALMYIKYETMYFALGLLKRRLLAILEEDAL